MGPSVPSDGAAAAAGGGSVVDNSCPVVEDGNGLTATTQTVHSENNGTPVTVKIVKTVCVCVCVFFLPIHSGHQVQWTLDVPAGVTQEKAHTGFLIHLLSAVRALIFLARRIQPFLSLVDREVEFLCTNDLIVLTRWAFLGLVFSFLVRKIRFAGIELTSQRVRRLHGYL